MSSLPNPFGTARPGQLEYESSADSITVAQFFNTVYAWMCVGLALSAVVGWYVAHSGVLNLVYGSRGGYTAIALGAFAIAWFVQAQVGRLAVGVATALFLVYAAIIGALLSGIFLVYPAKTLIAAFVLTAMPIVVAAMMLSVNPEAMHLLVADPLGIRMLIGAGVLQLIGMIVIWRMIQIEY